MRVVVLLLLAGCLFVQGESGCDAIADGRRNASTLCDTTFEGSPGLLTVTAVGSLDSWQDLVLVNHQGPVRVTGDRAVTLEAATNKSASSVMDGAIEAGDELRICRLANVADVRLAGTDGSSVSTFIRPIPPCG